MKKKIILTVFGILILLALYWIFNNSYIKISVSNLGSNSSPISYNFLNQGSDKTITLNSLSSVIKKRLSRGNYQVEVQQGDRNYFVLAKAKGFLRGTSINLKLVEEKNRQFIGNNPGPCMEYINNILVSSACEANFNAVNIHVPATASTPTYTLPNSASSNDGVVEGFFDSPSGTFVLLHDTNGAGGGHFIYETNSSLGLSGGTLLNGLNNSSAYGIQSYKTGFVVYNLSLNQAFYFSSPAAQPSSINLTKVDGDFAPTLIDISNGSILRLFGSDDEKSSEVTIDNGTNSKAYKFNQFFNNGSFCGTNHICLVSDGVLKDYDISDSVPRLVLTISNAVSVANLGNYVLVIKNDGVLNLNPDSGSGFLEYSFGDYKYNSLQPAATGYVLRLTNNQGGKVALYINRTVSNTESIDKQVAQLLKRPEISGISAYGQYIYISPNFGQLTYQASIGGFGPDPSTLQKVNSEINTDIKNAGINTNIYKVINPYE